MQKMMSISPSNPVMYQNLKGAVTKDILIKEQCYDYDNCIYFVSKEMEQDQILFGFKCNCTNVILQNGGQEVLDELFKENQIPKEQWLPGFDITLGIDTSKLPKTQKVKKNMSEEEVAAVKAQNEEIRKSRDKIADEICSKFS